MTSSESSQSRFYPGQSKVNSIRSAVVVVAFNPGHRLVELMD